ncbi:MAG: hypothetical protein Q7R72_00555 [bacterium]|nr:hypothetical protein [bacterium]
MENNRGIIRVLIALVVGFSVLFLIFAMAAKYVTSPRQASPSGDSYFSAGYEEKTSPMLNFLDSGNYGNYGNYSGESDRAVGDINSKNRSKYAGRVYLSSGNASYTIQPYEEYITIKNDGVPVNITGWKVTNSKGTRPIEYSQNSYVYPSAESAVIGQGTEFLDPSGKYAVGSIILGSGDMAIITTSGPFIYFPLPLTSNFRENVCLGYLENYPFNPPVEKQCPYPTNDSQIRTVTDECYDYLQSLNRCQNPQKTDLTRFDELTSQCRNFIKTRLNYPSCVTNNRYSPNFASKQWRVFLGKSHELWSANRETITLYDATNLIVDQISY